MLSSSIPSRTPRFAASVAATGAIIYISRGAYWLGAAVASLSAWSWLTTLSAC